MTETEKLQFQEMERKLAEAHEAKWKALQMLNVSTATNKRLKRKLEISAIALRKVKATLRQIEEWDESPETNRVTQAAQSYLGVIQAKLKGKRNENETREENQQQT